MFLTTHPFVNVPLKVCSKRGRLNVLVDDSAGLKVYGEGEREVLKQDKDKHCTWRKVHVAINAENQ
jgi:hypothetical protein